MQLLSEIDILHTLKPNTVKFSITVELSLISDLHGSMGVAVKSCRGALWDPLAPCHNAKMGPCLITQNTHSSS